LRIRNNSGHAFTLMHLYPSGSNFPGEAVLFFPNNPDNFILQNKEIIEFVYDTDSNRFEYFGANADISGKQDVLTETNFGAFENSLTAKATLLDADFISIVDTADSNKAKKVSLTNFKAYLLTWITGLFQSKDNQVEISTNSNVLNAWNGQTILFTANCTITIPDTLNNSLMFVFRTLAGVTVTWAITAPFTWETTPATTPEKTTGNFMRRGSTNTILLEF
jgi:hypothetical protein